MIHAVSQCPNEHNPGAPAVMQMMGDTSWKCTGLLPDGSGPCGYRSGRTGEQDAPVHNDGASMHDLAIEHLRGDGASTKTIEIMAARKALGLSRYQTILQAHNGRDWLADLIDELADATVYARQGVEEASAGTHEWSQAWLLYTNVLATYRGAVLVLDTRDRAAASTRTLADQVAGSPRVGPRGPF